MRAVFLLGLLAAFSAAMPAAASGDWQAVEEVRPYSISGKTGAELYESIGANGPKAGVTGRVIAHTTFKLTWTRKYEPQGTACVIVTNRPKLIITYTLPKPAAELPGPVKSNWEVFRSGVEAHERVHGDTIKEMVKEIETMSIGLTVADDPGCKKIRVQLTQYLDQLSKAQRQDSRDFDRVEFGRDGNMLKLIAAFLGGG